jgi:hypothetical protein
MGDGEHAGGSTVVPVVEYVGEVVFRAAHLFGDPGEVFFSGLVPFRGLGLGVG